VIKKTWYLYVVECADGTLYTGITTSIQRRLNEHNFGSRGAKYTRSRRPVKLMLTEEHAGHSSALKAEYRFKKLTRKQKKEIIDGRRNSTN
jgi:putative endonuclease